MTSEQRDFLRKQIDAHRRERLSAAEQSRRSDARLAKAPQRSSDEGQVIDAVAASVRAIRARVG